MAGYVHITHFAGGFMDQLTHRQDTSTGNRSRDQKFEWNALRRQFRKYAICAMFAFCAGSLHAR